MNSRVQLAILLVIGIFLSGRRQTVVIGNETTEIMIKHMESKGQFTITSYCLRALSTVLLM
jgi:hypothetical protein